MPQAALAGIDTENGRYTRINVTAGNVTPYGFTLTLNTWEDSIVHSVKASTISLHAALCIAGTSHFLHSNTYELLPLAR
jgi:tellurite resistance-related uncharacterized protein